MSKPANILIHGTISKGFLEIGVPVKNNNLIFLAFIIFS